VGLTFPSVPPNDNLSFRTGEFSLFMILRMRTPEHESHGDLERHTTSFQSGTRLHHMVTCISAAYLHCSQVSHIAQRPCAQRVVPHAAHGFTGACSASVGVAASGFDFAGASISFGFGIPYRSHGSNVIRCAPGDPRPVGLE
jgi:hypothetical protein